MKNPLHVMSLSLIILLSSCASADKMLERGDYDDMINLAVNKLSGKKKKEDYVIALEKGFEKVTRNDMARIESLRQSNRPEDWEEIIRVAHNIDRRQDRIDPLLPLVSENGYHAKFSFVHTSQIITEANTTLLNLYEKRLVELVSAARKDSKGSAREAYNLLGRMRNISSDYIRPELRNEMHELGLNYIMVQIENKSRAFLPAGLEDELMTADFSRLGDSWDRYYRPGTMEVDPDFYITLSILDILVTPDGLAERPTEYSKQIVDGWEYVLDAKGNVAKDSLGNDIKRDKWVKVNATVVETIQNKKALVRARVDIQNARSGASLCSENIEVEEVFNHVARKIYGDERALEPGQRGIILPLPFPSESALIWDAFQGLKPRFLEEVRHANFAPPSGT